MMQYEEANTRNIAEAEIGDEPIMYKSLGGTSYIDRSAGIISNKTNIFKKVKEVTISLIPDPVYMAGMIIGYSGSTEKAHNLGYVPYTAVEVTIIEDGKRYPQPYPYSTAESDFWFKVEVDDRNIYCSTYWVDGVEIEYRVSLFRESLN